MKRLALLLPLLLLLTACTPVNVPPADYDEPETAIKETMTETEPEPETETEPPETTARRTTTRPKSAESESEEDETETETEPLVIPDWAEGYAKLLRQKNADSSHQDACYALIRLDGDEIPELVVFDDQLVELYYDADGAPELLLEDNYKSSAASGQNFCYQPMTGKVASAFSTMGGGSGYNFFFYEGTPDPMHVTRWCFNNNEDEGGEMPYNELWDKADEFDIHNNGWTDVSLGESWTHIGTDFEDIHRLAPVTGKILTVDWNQILEDIHDPDVMDTTEEEED